MGLLDQLMGGGDRRNDYEDFANRYDSGAPDEGYDDDEVGQRYNEVAGEVDDDTYHESARDAFSRMDPDSRRAFAQDLYGRAQQSGVDLDYDGVADDPDSVARMTSQVRQRQPDLLGSLLGGGMGGMGGGLGGMLGGGGMGGMGGMGGVGGGLGGMLGGGGMGGGMGGMAAGNPLARAALAGITAMAARRMMNR